MCDIFRTYISRHCLPLALHLLELAPERLNLQAKCRLVRLQLLSGASGVFIALAGTRRRRRPVVIRSKIISAHSLEVLELYVPCQDSQCGIELSGLHVGETEVGQVSQQALFRVLRLND